MQKMHALALNIQKILGYLPRTSLEREEKKKRKRGEEWMGMAKRNEGEEMKGELKGRR
jgi:hypothetical protein